MYNAEHGLRVDYKGPVCLCVLIAISVLALPDDLSTSIWTVRQTTKSDEPQLVAEFIQSPNFQTWKQHLKMNIVRIAQEGGGSAAAVDLLGCQQACELAQPRCDAIAFNADLQACFLKQNPSSDLCQVGCSVQWHFPWSLFCGQQRAEGLAAAGQLSQPNSKITHQCLGHHTALPWHQDVGSVKLFLIMGQIFDVLRPPSNMQRHVLAPCTHGHTMIAFPGLCSYAKVDVSSHVSRATSTFAAGCAHCL